MPDEGEGFEIEKSEEEGEVAPGYDRRQGGKVGGRHSR